MEGMKHFGWSVIDSNGVIACQIVIGDKESADRYANTCNKYSTSGHPYRSVELFYKDEQP